MLTLASVDLSFESHKILSNINIIVNRGSKIVLTGCSGSGKSSLLHIMAGLMFDYQGVVSWDGHNIAKLSQKKILAWRRKNLGFIFQFHYLLKDLTVLENVMLPLILNDMHPKAAKCQAKELLQLLKIDHYDSKIATLSGGEKQRVAMARAIIHKPSVIIADEPTGSLDPNMAQNVIDVLLNFAEDSSIVMATHNLSLVPKFQQHFEIYAGELIAR